MGTTAYHLTERQTEIVRLIGEGKRNDDIARELGLSPGTVASHRVNCVRRLRLRGAGALLRYASMHAQPGILVVKRSAIDDLRLIAESLEQAGASRYRGTVALRVWIERVARGDR